MSRWTVIVCDGCRKEISGEEPPHSAPPIQNPDGWIDIAIRIGQHAIRSTACSRKCADVAFSKSIAIIEGDENKKSTEKKKIKKKS